jgi:hypothetical protein
LLCILTRKRKGKNLEIYYETQQNKVLSVRILENIL